jgi:hypothetical protein
VADDKLDVPAALKELAEKDQQAIEEETAYKWASRAIACYLLFQETDEAEWLLRGDDYRHEAVEHAALMLDPECAVLKDLTLRMQEYRNAAPVQEADFDPAEHPRDEEGQFTSAGGSGAAGGEDVKLNDKKGFAKGAQVRVVPTEKSPVYTIKRRDKVGTVLWDNGKNVKIKIGKQSFTFDRDELQPQESGDADIAGS